MARARSGDAREDVAAAVLGLALVALFVVFAVADAGFDPLVWLPGGLFALGLLAVEILARPAILDGVPRSTSVAIALFAAFTAWTFLSIAWADVRGIAWEGANRTLLYAVVYTLVAIWPWRASVAAAILGAFSVSVAVVGAAAVLLTVRSDSPLSAFVGGLFSEPVGYHNANAALFLVAFWPALMLASRREVPPLARGLFLATAGLLLPLAVLPQSRGSLIAFPLTLLVFLAIAPNRARCLLTLVPIVVSTLLALGPLLDVYGPDGEREAVRALEEARNIVAPMVVALFVVGLVAGLVERRVQIPPAFARVAGRVLGAAAVVGCVVGILVVLPPHPVGRAADAWQEFKAGHRPDTGSSHFTSGFGSNRYDFWRVGLEEFARSPLHGIGADNFAAPYVRDRRSDEEPLYPHSVEVQVLSQTGLVGVALFLGFLVSAVLAAARARHLDPFGRAVAVAGVTPFVYWLGHGSVDWLWELPGLGAPALAGLALAAGLARLPPPEAPGRSIRRIAVRRRRHLDLRARVVRRTLAGCQGHRVRDRVMASKPESRLRSARAGSAARSAQRAAGPRGGGDREQVGRLAANARVVHPRPRPQPAELVRGARAGCGRRARGPAVRRAPAPRAGSRAQPKRAGDRGRGASATVRSADPPGTFRSNAARPVRRAGDEPGRGAELAERLVLSYI